jgi:hypothetical protein
MPCGNRAIKRVTDGFRPLYIHVVKGYVNVHDGVAASDLSRKYELAVAIHNVSRVKHHMYTLIDDVFIRVHVLVAFRKPS